MAAGDHSAAVMDSALDAAQAVTAALFRGVGIGGDYFGEVCNMLETAMRNPAHEKLSATAAGIFPILSQRLAAADEKVCISAVQKFASCSKALCVYSAAQVIE